MVRSAADKDESALLTNWSAPFAEFQPYLSKAQLRCLGPGLASRRFATVHIICFPVPSQQRRIRACCFLY